MRFLLGFLLVLSSAAASAEVSAIYGEYGPTGSVLAGQPTLRWKLTPTGGGHVTRVEMLVNKKAVPADYNSTASAVEYAPAEPLSKGMYAVVCNVTIDREVVARQDWTFEVGDSSASSVDSALEATNEIRRELGLPELATDSRMNAAAAAHSRYQLLNRETGHYEDPGKPGYTGKAPWDRIKKFGYPGLCFECACGNQLDPRRAVRLLFDAPYHRIAFLQPGSPQVGIGFDSGALTIDYAISGQEKAMMSPAPDQRGIPVEWDGNESPSPLRIHGASGAVGYPIVFSWFTPRLENLRLASMRLLGPDGAEIPAYLNSPENDSELRFAAVLVPKRKLTPGTTYSVQVRAASQRGVKIDRDWSFTTR